MSWLKSFSLISMVFVLSGCIGPLALFGGAVGAGATLSKEKTVGSTVDDHTIWTKIKAGFLEHNKEVEGILTNVSVEVSEGRVLLTGFVKTPDERLIVLRIVWQQNGVREVINEIKLSGETNQSNAKQYSKDTWITTQVRSKMFLNDNVRSINFSVETIDGVVYVLGIARSEAELNAIREIAEGVQGVNRFVTYIRVESKPETKAQKKAQGSEPKEEVLFKGEQVHVEDEKKAEPSHVKPEEVDEEEIEIEYLDSDD
jgi:osmotically-inducible protein OsmY